jgi:arylsulfatase A-like enzyme
MERRSTDLAPPTTAGGAEPPNILLLFTDQQRADALGCSGNPFIQTPNLDRLASEGIRFSQAVTTTPVCIASRYSLITGLRMREHHWGANASVPGPRPELPTLMTLLGGAGYRTHGIGKFHFQPTGRHHGFHKMELMEEIPRYRVDDDYLCYLQEQGYGHIREVHGVRNLLYQQPQTTIVPEAHVGSTWVADRTCAFLREHAGGRPGRPFFLWSSWIAPHPPWNVPESFRDMYDPNELPLPVYVDRPEDDLSPQAHMLRNVGDGADQSPARLRAIKARYYAQVSLIDKCVGRILAELERLGLAGNTLVIFASDHGEMLGDHGLWQKSSPYEASVRIPFLLRWPDREPGGQVREQLVSLLDVLPTCLAAAGVTYAGPHDPAGVSLLTAEGRQLADQRDALVIDHGLGPQRWLCLRERTTKYAVWLSSGKRELYDLANDPEERHNLIDTEPERAAALERRLVDWERRHGFAESLDGDHFRTFPVRPAGRGRNGQFPFWVATLPADERSKMQSPGQTVMDAIRHETSFRLEELDLRAWKAAGGDLRGTPYEAVWAALPDPPPRPDRA